MARSDGYVDEVCIHALEYFVYLHQARTNVVHYFRADFYTIALWHHVMIS